MIPKYTIAICTYNGGERIIHVLNSIYAQHQLKQLVSKIIVVDNKSTDDTKKYVLDYQVPTGSVELLYGFEGDAGLSNARKKCIELCYTEWLVFLDDDNFIKQDWLLNIDKYISENPQVGVLNGAIIPVVPFKMNLQEQKRLKASLKVLACTHYDEKDLEKHPNTPFRNPIGAGMVVRTAPLKKLLEQGWLHSKGRTAETLTSGEDTEMAIFVKKEGYDFGFCEYAVLQHQMNQNRLQHDYLLKIWYEIGRGVALVMNKEKYSLMTNICYEVLLYCRLFFYLLQSIYKFKYYKSYIKGFHKEKKFLRT